VRVNVAIPEAHVKAPVLDAALESVTRLNEQMLAEGAPSFERALRRFGIKWRPEPPGQEHFDHLQTVLRRGHGDCDDLAPWHAASLRHSGEDPRAQAIVKRSGPRRWHAIVQRGDGSIDDPSKRAGMGQPEGHRGAAVPLMFPHSTHGVSGAFVVRPQLALRPVRGGYQSRVDVPWHYWANKAVNPTEYNMTTLHTAPVASAALVGAIEGACSLALAGDYADPDHLDRLCAIADSCEGDSFDELAEVYGLEHAEAADQLVGFFGDIMKGIKSVAKTALPIAKMAAPFVPIPGLAPGLALAEQGLSMLPGGGGGGGHGGAPVPGAPAMTAQPGRGGGFGGGRICFPATFE
jgi:hypothetical protein